MCGVKGADGEPRYLNREISWLKFNRRVLEEAANPENPLLERLRFLAIAETNLDEFYMVRVSGLIEEFESGVLEVTPDGLSPNEQLLKISDAAGPQRRRGAEIYHTDLKPALAANGVSIRGYSELTDKQRRTANEYFHKVVFPLCTPILLHPVPTVPFISNRSLNLAIELRDPGAENRLARVKVPTVIPRAVRIAKRRHEYVLLEDLIANNLQALFPGVDVLGCHMFRVVRDADVEVREFEARDMIATIEETLRLRRYGEPVLMQHEPTMPPHVRKRLMSILQLDKEDLISVDGPLGFEVFYEIARIDRPSLRFRPHIPYLSEKVATAKGLFTEVKARDLLVHHPYDSFRTEETFAASAVSDPAVIGIKQTLYRVGTESPIVESLLSAAEAGKQVAAMVELKARFDESNNLGWARALEQAGVHVTYGFPEMKTHCKLALVVRREANGVRSYGYVGTGNFNPATARQYTDIGFFTCDEAITQDISELFNYLTGFSKQKVYRKLLVAPLNLRENLIARVRAQAKLGKDGRIIWKLNHIVDPPIIDALYEASCAGVQVDLIVRGQCCLRPGVAGLSENIRVVSIVGRFLEHSRIFSFGDGEDGEVYIGSADAMRRNMDRRIEVLVPIENGELKQYLREQVLQVCLSDNTKAWDLMSDGSYTRRKPQVDGKPFVAQSHFIAHPTSRELLGH